MSVRARWTGKAAKAWAQDLAVGLALLPPLATHHHGLVVAVLCSWWAVGLTLGLRNPVHGRPGPVRRTRSGRSVRRAPWRAWGPRPRAPGEHGERPGARTSLRWNRPTWTRTRAPCALSAVAVGTELLLGQIVDTNSAWLGERLALAGIDSSSRPRSATTRPGSCWRCEPRWRAADAVIVCGGLGPTQDDITREAIAEVMNVRLVRDEAIVERIGPCSGRGAGRCRRATCARPRCPRARR